MCWELEDCETLSSFNILTNAQLFKSYYCLCWSLNLEVKTSLANLLILVHCLASMQQSLMRMGLIFTETYSPISCTNKKLYEKRFVYYLSFWNSQGYFLRLIYSEWKKKKITIHLFLLYSQCNPSFLKFYCTFIGLLFSYSWIYILHSIKYLPHKSFKSKPNLSLVPILESYETWHFVKYQIQ